MRRQCVHSRPAAASLVFVLAAFLAAATALAQAPPIIGTAPVDLRASNRTPQTNDTFTIDVVVDLTSVTGTSPSGSAPAALSAFRIPITFDKTRLQLTAVGSGTDPLFAAAGIDFTPIAAANATGGVTISGTLSGGSAPVTFASVATLTFRAISTGPAGISTNASAASLASAIQGGTATLFGPTAIPARNLGGGVVVQLPPSLKVSLLAGPAPINPNGRLVYTIRCENAGGADATGVTLTAPIPANTTYLASSAGGTLSGSNVQWTIGTLTLATPFEATVAVTVNGAAGTTIAPLVASASATNTVTATGASAFVAVVARAIVKPGSIMTMTSYGGDSGTIYDVTTGTPKLFGRISSAGWAGALLFTPDGTLYATSNAYGGALFDATAGGDLTGAVPIARGLGNRITGIATDANGNIYVSTEMQGAQIRRIAPNGSVTLLPPIINSPGGMLVVGTTLYISEGGSGKVQKIDLATNAVTTQASGFPTGTDHFSGQLVRVTDGRLFVLWADHGTSRGLFDISAAGPVNLSTPKTAANAFRCDINQLATDSANVIYFGGNGTGAVYRATPSGSNYGAATVFAPGVPECESLAMYPRPQATLLVLTAAASLTETFPGREITYTLAYENAGATAAASATLSFNVPAGTTFVSASGGGTLTGSTVNWNAGSIAGGGTGSRTVTVLTTASGGSTINSTATITGGGSTGTTALPSIAVFPPPVLDITVAASAASTPNGSHIVYTIGYGNSGGSAAPATKIRNVIPANAVFVAAFDGGTLVNSAPEWTIGTLEPGRTGSVTFVVRANGAAGASINNNAATISATGVPAVTAAPAITTITAATLLTATITAGPSPVIPGTQVNAFVTYTNAASSVPATNVVVNAVRPPDSVILSVTGGGIAGANAITWTIPSVAAGATQTFRYSFRTNAAPGLITLVNATIRSDQHPLFTSAPARLEVRPLPTSYLPGTVLSGLTYIAANNNEEHPVRILTASNTLVTFATPPITSWLGALHIARNRHLYAATGDSPVLPSGVSGAIYDLTAGGDLKGATPLVKGLGHDLVDLTSDDQGNLYAIRRLPEVTQRVMKITPEGEMTVIGPNIEGGSGIFWLGGLIYYSESTTGRILKFDPLTTAAPLPHASGFPAFRDHISGHFVRNQQGRLFVLWTPGNGNNTIGLFDITDPMTWTSTTPAVTAKNAFRGDMNEMALGLDNSIYFAGNGGNGIHRAPFVNGAYGPTVTLTAAAGDNEALTIVPRLDLSINASVAPLRALSGDELTWTLSYTNDSTTAALNAFVESPLPAGASFVSAANGGTLQNGIVRWSIGTILAGGTGSVLFTTKITAAEGATVTLQSSFISADGIVGAYISPVSVTVERPLAIDASAEPGPVLIGSNVTFTLRYENLNANAATNVILRATPPAGTTFGSASNGGALVSGAVTFSLGTIAAGGEDEVTFTVRANALPSITLADYSVTSSEFGTRAGTPLTVPVLPLPRDLRVSVTDAPDPVTSGETLTYTLNYSNAGGSAALFATLYSAVPEGTTFVGATGGGRLSGDTNVNWDLGNLAAGDSGSVTLTVKVTAPGGSTITNDSVILGSDVFVNAAPVTTAVIAPPPPPPIVVTLSAQPSPVIAGGLLEYTIEIGNPADEAVENVVAAIVKPEGTSFVSATGGGTAEEGSIQWTLGTLAAHAHTSVTFTVRVDADAGAVIVNGGATVTATNRPAATSNSVTTQVIQPPATLRLLVGAPESVLFGGNITYTLTFANDGPSSVTSAQIADPLPSGTTLVSASDGGTLANGIVTWSLGTLTAGASGTRTLVVATSQLPGSTVANGGATLTSSSVSASGNAALTGIVAPALAVDGTLSTDKTDYVVPEAVQQNATFTYNSGGSGLLAGLTATLTTTNATGGIVATHVESISTLTAGASASISFIWNTTNAASGAYVVTFTVADATGAELLTRTTNITVSALDGSGLTGTIAPASSPVSLGAALQTHYTVANTSRLAYEPLALEIIVADPITLAPLVTVPVSTSVASNGSASGDAQVATGALAVGDYPLWLTTTAGTGRLLATSTFSVNAPRLTLEPGAITIAAGASGTLTAKIAAPLAVPAIVTLASSNASVASVPASVTIPAGATSQTIAVQGIAIGGPVTITATSGGSSASSTVLVVASGTLTATLQVYQGENVSFGVMITNGGATALQAAPFTIDILDPSSGNVIESIPLTVTVAAGATFQTTLQHGTSTLAFQKYNANLVFTGVAPPQVIAHAEFEVLAPPPLRLDAGVGSAARLLIWNNCSQGNSGNPCTPVAPAFLTQTLQTASIPYVLSGEQNDFLAKMRTGAFSGAVIDQIGSSEAKIADEYLNDVHAGYGLLFIHPQPNAMPKFTPALGAEFHGRLQGPSTVQLLTTPFTSPGTWTLNGDGVHITLAGAHAAATLSGSNDAAITYREFGRGHVVTVPFDLEQTQTLDTSRFILASVGWITRTIGPTFAAREVVPVHLSVTTPPGGATPVDVTITLSSGMSVIDAVPALTSTNPLRWSVAIPGNTTQSFDLWVRLPDAARTATVTLAASLPGGPPIVTKSVDFNVAPDAPALAASLSTELAALRTAATKNTDVKAVDDASAQLTQLLGSSDALANIARVLRILDELAKVSLDTGPARVAADRLLVYWQSKAV